MQFAVDTFHIINVIVLSPVNLVVLGVLFLYLSRDTEMRCAWWIRSPIIFDFMLRDLKFERPNDAVSHAFPSEPCYLGLLG
jgi:hypothetical protein